MGKTGIQSIFKGYLDTLRTGFYGNRSFTDYMMHFALPVLIGSLPICLPCVNFIQVRGVFSLGITAISIASALLGGIAVFLFQLRLEAVSNKGTLGKRADQMARIDEVFSDVLWAVVAGIISALFMVLSVAGVGVDNIILDVFTFAAIAFSANFLIVVGMCLKRLNLMYLIVSKEWGRAEK